MYTQKNCFTKVYLQTDNKDEDVCPNQRQNENFKMVFLFFSFQKNSNWNAVTILRGFLPTEENTHTGTNQRMVMTKRQRDDDDDDYDDLNNQRKNDSQSQW